LLSRALEIHDLAGLEGLSNDASQIHNRCGSFCVRAELGAVACTGELAARLRYALLERWGTHGVFRRAAWRQQQLQWRRDEWRRLGGFLLQPIDAVLIRITTNGLAIRTIQFGGTRARAATRRQPGHGPARRAAWRIGGKRHDDPFRGLQRFSGSIDGLDRPTCRAGE